MRSRAQVARWYRSGWKLRSRWGCLEISIGCVEISGVIQVGGKREENRKFGASKGGVGRDTGDEGAERWNEGAWEGRERRSVAEEVRREGDLEGVTPEDQRGYCDCSY
jgi:hypothetical protein